MNDVECADDYFALGNDVLRVLAAEHQDFVEFPHHKLEVVHYDPGSRFLAAKVHVVELTYDCDINYKVKYIKYLVLARQVHRGWVCARDLMVSSWGEEMDLREYPCLKEILEAEAWFNDIIQGELVYLNSTLPPLLAPPRLTSSSSALAAVDRPSQTPAGLVL
jgi:hypothetical protein